MKLIRSAAILFALALLAPPVPALAQTQPFPSRPIKLVVPFAPGGGTDFFARVLAPKLGDELGQPVIVDNRPGGATNIAAEFVAKALPDGYTLMLSSLTTFAINPALFTVLPYDPVKSFSPVGLTGRFPFLLVVNANVPVDSVAKFVAYYKSKAGSLSYGSSGIGSVHQLGMDLFLRRAGIEGVHVAYKGAGPAVQDLIGGQIPAMLLDVATALPQLKSGRIRALAVASKERLPTMPDIPTLAESGYPGFEATTWQGLVAPAQTPAPIIQKLNAALERTLADPDVRKRLLEAGIEPLKSTPEEFTTYQRAEIQKWSEVIKHAGIKPE
jgi:tripartite-type tricarboxylate transporter receptor subunit TctC